MTDPTQEESNETPEPARREWVGEAQGALDRTTEALRAAWAESRDTRIGALQSAKRAAKELGDAIDRGVTVAKERWEASGRDAGEASGETSAAETSIPPPEEE